MAAEDPNQPLFMIIVMGVTGAGKSYFCNKLAGCKISEEGSSLKPCTQTCLAVPAQIYSSKVLIIDTPGFDDAERTEAEILTEISRILTFQYEQGVQLKGIIYAHRISDIRYTRAGVKTLKIFNEICGKNAMHNVLLMTTRWDEVDEEVGAERERQLRRDFWAYMLNNGSTMTRYHGTHDSAIALASLLLSKSTTVLQLQHEIVVQGKVLHQTAAGAMVNDDVDTLRAQHEQDLQDIRNLKNTLRENDWVMRKKMEEDWAREQAFLKRAEEDKELLRRQIAAEVRAEVEAEQKKKPGKWRKALPFIPAIMSVIGLFVGIPPGTFELFGSWLGSFGMGDSLTDIFS